MIYFIQSGRFVKIGYASNPKRRIGTLKTGSPRALASLSSSSDRCEPMKPAPPVMSAVRVVVSAPMRADRND